MNSQTIPMKGAHSCHKHSKSRTDEVSTHAPTIRCHEEVMSKLSSCTNEDCIGNQDNCIEQCCHHKKPKFKKEKVKTLTSKCKPGYHSVSAPSIRLTGSRHKDLHPKTVKSNLEDSVDYIPVKLTSANQRKQRPQKKVRHNFESRQAMKEKPSKPYRPTWDEILRNNLEIVSKPNKGTPGKSLTSDKSNYSNCCQSERSYSSTSKKKDSLKKIDNCHEQDDLKQDCLKQTIKFSESTESPKSENVPIFQQINSCDPIKTLDFLIGQLRNGLLRQPPSDSLQNIILDMENALTKISSDNKSSSSHPFNRDMVEMEGRAASVPQSAASSCSHEKTRNKHLDVLQLEHNLEKSCRYLQSLCIKQKQSCNNHLREKEQLSLQLAESRRLLAVSKSKEKNYEVTIGELRLKLQEANTKIDQLKQSLQDVENKNVTLKEENQAMASMKESMKRVGVRLKQIASEKEKLQSKLSLKDLEIEKLKVLLQVKTNQNNNMKQDNKLLSDGNDLDVKIYDDDKDLSMTSLSTVTSWSERPGLICSSQASSTPRHSPSPYNSWQHISSIVQQPSAADDINRGIAIILQDLKMKSEQLEPLQLELQNPSSCSSLWSDREAVGSKVAYSDGESVSFSS